MADLMTPVKAIRVMIVDDHDMLRRGLAVFLDTCEDVMLVGEAASGAEAVERAAQVNPHVILMDLIMPDMNGVEAIELIRQQQPNVQIVVLTTFHNEELVQGALKAGAIGYLLKNVSIDELSSAIHDAYNGHPTLAREAAQALVSAAQRPNSPNFKLTNREAQVLTLMIKGLNNSEIADHLTISRSTVKKHVSNILNKLNTTSRTEAVAIAVQNRVVTIP